MGLAKILIATTLFILCLGCIAGGAVLCWQSTKHHTCGDWETHSPYYPFDKCSYTSLDLIARSKCDSLCYCVSPLYDYTCIDKLPGGASATFIGGGIALIVVGIVGIGAIAYFILLKDVI